MKILKQGDLNKLKKTINFTCQECGCIFEADKDEYEIRSHYNERYCCCECPFCGNEVYNPYELL